MNRLKFRAWNGRAMEYGGFSIHATGKTLSLEGLTRVNEKSPVMQYTGLKDKNGVEIYEGDIVVDREIGLDVPYCEIEWKKEMAGFYLKQWSEQLWDLGDAEVIGNIHESPELVNTLNQTEDK